MHTAPTRLIRSGAISASTLTNIAVVAIVVCALYFGRQILVPVALAILLSFVLSPPVRLLQGKYFPRGAAVGVVALLAFAAIFGLGTILAAQVRELASDLPQYQATLAKKIQTLRGATTGAGTLKRASLAESSAVRAQNVACCGASLCRLSGLANNEPTSLK
ncbi:MAG: AI-2E family transporter [Xanthobacteraceae bacterium]